MKPGKLLYTALAGFIAFSFGIVGSWFALTMKVGGPMVSPQEDFASRLIIIGALWLTVFAVTVGLYSGGKESKWELPTYETFDGRRIPVDQAIDEAVRQQNAARKQEEKPIVEPSPVSESSSATTSAAEAVQALETPKVGMQQAKQPDDKDWDYSYRGEVPKRKRSGINK